MKKEIETLMLTVEGIRDAAKASNRELNDDEIEKSDTIYARVEQLEKLTALEERAKATEARLSETATVIPAPGNIEKRAYGSVVVNDEFRDIGEFACAMMNASIPGGKVDDRLYRTAGTGLATTADATGAVMVPSPMSKELLEEAFDDTNLATYVTKIPMESKTLDVPYVDGYDHSGGTVYGGVQWHRKTELAQYTSSRPAFEDFTLTLAKLTGLAFSSDEMLKFSAFAIKPLLTRGFGRGLKLKLNNEILSGTGADGQMTGIYNSNCLITISGGITTANAIEMYSRVHDKSSAKWIGSSDAMPTIYSLEYSGGHPAFLPAGGFSNRPADTLLGRPVIWCDSMPAGNLMIANLEDYVMGQPIGSPEFEEATSISFKFDYGQLSFRWTTYNAGQCGWSTYHTPHVGSNTRSPFVTLSLT